MTVESVKMYMRVTDLHMNNRWGPGVTRVRKSGWLSDKTGV